MKFMTACDSMSSSIENKLETISISRRKIERKRVAIVKFKMNKRRRNTAGCSTISSNANASKVRI